MLRESEFQVEYGLIAAGAVNSSFIGKLPGKTRALGPVAGMSYRVASRIANSLRAGVAARSPQDLDAVRVILFHSPAAQHTALIDLLRSAAIQWEGKSLIICDSATNGIAEFEKAGASVSVLRSCPIPGRMIVEGANPSLAIALRLARSLRMKAIPIETGSVPAIDAAITIATAALMPLIDHCTELLRQCGLRDSEAVKLASSLFQQTAREYAHSGRQSWARYSRDTDLPKILNQMNAIRDDLRPAVRELTLSALPKQIREALKTRP